MADPLDPWHPAYQPPQGPVVLTIMDGIGLGPPNEGNAVAHAHKPVVKGLFTTQPTLRLTAHGTAVGLPTDKDMGNSEVGHTIMGAGRILPQGASLVQQAIESAELFNSETWRSVLTRCADENGGTLHFIGLLSDGNVHSHIDHLLALIEDADRNHVEHVRVHALLDGRDVEPRSAMTYVDRLEAALAQINQSEKRDYRIASGGGRMQTTMDRYWERVHVVEAGWRAHVLGEGRAVNNARSAIEDAYAKGVASDQDIEAFVVADEAGHPVGTIEDGDAVVLFNFRGDRAIELSLAFDSDAFSAFDRVRRPDVLFVGMLQYDGDLEVPKQCLLVPPRVSQTWCESLSDAGIDSFHIAESSKYGHVTYYLFGMRQAPYAHTHCLEVSSGGLEPAEHPQMKAKEVADEVIKAIASGTYRLIVVNFANGDMVGHTGNFQAAVRAVETVDAQIGRILEAVESAKGILLVTADHGNAEEMYHWSGKHGEFKRNSDGSYVAKTSHTLNLVPFIIRDTRADSGYGLRRDLPRPGLANIGATVLNLLGYAAPDFYAPSLVRIQAL